MSTRSPAYVSIIPVGPAPVHNAVGTVSTGPTPCPACSRTQGRQTLLHSVYTGWIKSWSLCSTWVTFSITAVLTVLFGAGLIAVLRRTEEHQDTVKNLIIQGLTPGQVIVTALGALIITGEYSSGQIRSSLAAAPKHRQPLAFKAVALVIVFSLPGLVSVSPSWAILKSSIGEHADSLTDSHYIGYIWGSGLVFATITLLALGLGFLLCSTAGTITVIVSLLFIINGPLQLVVSKRPWIFKITGRLSSTVAEVVSGPFQRTTEQGGQRAQFLAHGQAIATFAVWAPIPLVIAWVVSSRRDAWANNSPAVNRR